MAKFFGVIGYMTGYDESKPFQSDEIITEREYFGDVIQFKRRWDSTEYQNDTFNVDNKISIVADPFAYEHFHAVRYVQWMGVKWKVTNVEVQYPRLILTIGVCTMKTLTDLGARLSEVTGLPLSRIKFKPPGKEKLQYPCITYTLSRIDPYYADDTAYFDHKGYLITYMDKDPVSEIPDKIRQLPMCKFDRFYTVDNLNHWVFTIYF